MKYEFLASWTSKLFTKDIKQFKKGIKFVKLNRRLAKDAVFVAQLSIIHHSPAISGMSEATEHEFEACRNPEPSA